MSGDTSHRFDFQISPSRWASPIRPAQGQAKTAYASAWVFSDECRLSGWLLPASHGAVQGLRAVQAGKSKPATHVAQRKQLRPDVYFNHPDHPEALKSGFRLALPVSTGRQVWTLQFKNASGTWVDFCTLTLRVPPLWKLWQRLMPYQPVGAYEAWCQQQTKAEAQRASAVIETLSSWPNHPTISVLLPVFNPPERWLTRAIDSVLQQSYPHWQLCIADDHSTAPHIRPLLEAYARRDPRIKVTFRAENGHICHASNTALETCSGDFTALFDHDDELPPHALLRVAQEIIDHPDANLIFSDEDKIDTHGVRFDPYFKPGRNLELLYTENFICHFGVYRTPLMRQLGGFRPGLEGAQDWDLALRVVAAVDPTTIHHIPQILYHWRTLETSTASQQSAKPYAIEAGNRAVRDHLARTHPTTSMDVDHRVRWPMPEPLPKVSIIVPTRDRIDLLQVAVESLFEKTTYPNLELIIVDHASSEPATAEYFDQLRQNPLIKIHRAEGEFNWSRLNNFGVQHATGDLYLFLNNDVEIINSEWLDELVANVSRPGIGAVGACLLYPNRTLQHAGVALRLLGMAGHPFQSLQPNVRTVAGNPSSPREVTAVTGACLIVSRENFSRAGGFDEANLPISYNDIDFCLRLRSFGLRNLYAAHAVLIHHESASRHTLEKESLRKAAATTEAQVILHRWPEEFKQDAFYNPNLSLLTTLPIQASDSD